VPNQKDTDANPDDRALVREGVFEELATRLSDQTRPGNRVGKLAMQQWGIRPVPDEERLDLTHYPKEFVEF
jgi:hypothetical protein